MFKGESPKLSEGAGDAALLSSPSPACHLSTPQVSQDGKALLDVLQRPLSPGNSESLTASANYSKAVSPQPPYRRLRRTAAEADVSPFRFTASWTWSTRFSITSGVWRTFGSTERSDFTRDCSCVCSSRTSSRYREEIHPLSCLMFVSAGFLQD